MNPFKALVLAAGSGARLGALGEQISKPMLRIRSKPVLEWHVRALSRAGVEEIWLNVHHQADQIRAYFGDGSRFGTHLRYSHEAELLGTAGALRNLAGEFRRGPFFVVYGDNYADLDYAALSQAQRGLATILLHHRYYVAESGVVELGPDNRILQFQEKPAPGREVSHWVNAGVYACRPELLEYLPDGRSDFGSDVFPRLLAQGCELYGIMAPVQVVALDTPEMLAEAEPLRIAQIGAGKIGARRVGVWGAAHVTVVADVDLARAQAVAGACGAEAVSDWHVAVEDERVNLVSVATPNHLLAPVARRALELGKHVLVEKPAALHSSELPPLIELARRRQLVLQAGFNYRFHPAIQRAKVLLAGGAIGRILHGTARHGHGGRLGLENEWRAQPELAGGGELLDQGVHLIDLFRWFTATEIVSVQAVLATDFWPVAPLEDHALAWLENAHRARFSIEASLTQWKNLFYFELVGELGTLILEGLGGSYGPERLTLIRRPAEFGIPLVETQEFSNPDDCWRAQWEELETAIRGGREPNGSGSDALAALRVVEACRLSSLEQRAIPVAT